MTTQNYAFIKDGIVVNFVVFDSPTQELLDHFKNDAGLDAIVLEAEGAAIGGTWDGINFTPPIEEAVTDGNY